MAAHVGEVIPKVAEVSHRLLVDSFEAEVVSLVVILDLLDDTGNDFRRESFLALDHGDDHAFSDRQRFQAVLVRWAANFRVQQGKTTVEVLGNIPADSVSD